MLFLKIVNLLLFNIILFVTCLEPLIKNANNYGPYTVTFDHYGDCKGPKSKNATIMTTEMNRQLLVAAINFTFLFDAKIDEIKIQMHTIKDNKKLLMWSHKFTNPCKHYAMAALIQHNLKANNCFVKKGFYNVELHYKELINSFLGSSFFYGTYSSKSEVISSKGNIACYNSTITFKKAVTNDD